MSAKVLELRREDLDPNEFRITATDTKGHSVRQWFRCIPAMARQVEETVQAKKFPYRTRGDLLRHALHRHMRWLQTQGGVASMAGQVDVILELMRDEEMNNDFVSVFGKLEHRINQHLQAGSKSEAVRLVATVLRYINSMPDGHWKEKYLARVQSQWKDLVRGAGKADLGRMED